MSDAVSKPQRVSLSRDFSEFLIELSVALHKHAMYPSGHPSLGPAAEGVTRRIDRLLHDRETLAFGVARHQLIIEGIATDPKQPVLRRLAEGLHRHHLGAISFSHGLKADEMGSVLRSLAAEVENEGALGLAPAEKFLSWPHVRLHPLTFDRLELIDAPDGTATEPRGAGAELWIGLARAAMASDNSGQSSDGVATEPLVVAKAIDEHQGAAAYDQVIVGYLLQIANELKTASGSDAAALRRRTARLIGALKPDTLRRLVEMGGNAAQRRAFIMNATGGMAVEAVIEILKAAADASGQTISHGLIRMLSKLAAHAELGHEQARPLADGALREQVERLLSGWQLADPNPDAYRKVLQHLATTAPVGTLRGDRPPALPEDESEPLRIVQMSLEVGGFGPLVDRAIDRAINDGAIGSVRQLLASTPTGSESAAEALMTKLRQPATVAMLVAREPLDVESLDQLLPSISIEGYTVLLDALVTSGSRLTRRKLLDRLVHTDLDVAPLIVARLEDERWYVQRNMLVLLQGLGRAPAGFSATRWTKHPDARVRYEAINLQLGMPRERDLALRTALEDLEFSIMRLGLVALQQGFPPAMTSFVIRVALEARIIEELRLLAVRALGHSREPRALNALLSLVDGGKTLLGKPKLAPRSPMVLTAVKALAKGWSADPRAEVMLDLAAGSSDPEVRQAAQPNRT